MKTTISRHRSGFPILVGFLLVITFLAQPQTAAAQTEDATADSAIEKLFSPDNPIGLIIRDFPEERAPTEARLRQAFESSGAAGLQQITYNIGRELGAKYTRHYAARASDKAILDFLDMQIQGTAELSTRNPAQCLGWLMGSGGQIRFSPYMTNILTARFSELVSSGVQSKETQRLLTPEEMQAMSTTVIQGMMANFPQDHLYFEGMRNPAAVTGPALQLKTCYTFLAFFKSIGALEPADAVAYFRTSLVSQQGD